MAKKQSRVKLKDLSGYVEAPVYLNFILKSGSVHLARPMEMIKANLKIKTAKGHILQLPLKEIDEIWADTKVDE